MAFIRSYSRNFDLDDVGDPFVGRLWRKVKKFQPGRAIRKFQPGRALMSVARSPLLGVVPGVGIIGRLAALAARYGTTVDTVTDIARNYGYDVGDPGPGGKPRKRQGGKRSTQRQQSKGGRRKGKAKGPGRRPSGSRQSIDWGSVIEKGLEAAPAIGQAAAEAYGQLRRQGVEVVPGAGIVPSSGAGLEAAIARELGGMGGMGRRRAVRIDPRTGRPMRSKTRTINLTALNRALSRVGKFQKTASRVMRSKQWRRVQGPAPGGARGRMKGHKPGCGCVACR